MAATAAVGNIVAVTMTAPTAGPSSFEADPQVAPGATSCWLGALNADHCCDTGIFGPGGNEACWDEYFTFARCCPQAGGGQPRSTPDVLGAAGASRGRQLLQEPCRGPGGEPCDGAPEVSRSCWRQGYNFLFCCTRARPGGNPECWDGQNFTYSRCCHPPPPPSPAAFVFEDVNCERSGPGWEGLRSDIASLFRAAEQGQLLALAQPSESSWSKWAWRLKRRAGLTGGECPLGQVALHVALLLLCLADRGACSSQWAAVARAMRHDALRLSDWLAAKWPALELFRHVSNIVRSDDAGCSREDHGMNWPLMFSNVGSGILEDEVMRALSSTPQDIPSVPFGMPCQGGHQWVAIIKFSLCARSEVKCARTHARYLELKLVEAARSGAALRSWVSGAGEWQLFTWLARARDNSVRHEFSLGLSLGELRELGVEPGDGDSMGPGSAHGCMHGDVDRGHATVLVLGDMGTYRVMERCRGLCGGSRDANGHAWAYYGPFRDGTNPTTCICAADGAEFLGSGDRAGLNCTGGAWLYPMPSAAAVGRVGGPVGGAAGAGGGGLAVDSLPIDGLDGQATLAAADVLAETTLDRSATVFTTMVFGHMARYLAPFAARVRALGIPNVVVFVLDDEAEQRCRAELLEGSRSPCCLRGQGRTALQKYIVVLTFLRLGFDVFWFDFDSVWLKNPWPVLQGAIADAEAEAVATAGEKPDVLSGIDFDSINCAMNAFFWVRATESARLWLLALLHWIYRRPYAHDQLAFSTLLGVSPLIDEDPLPTPPIWAPLDPNVFANAAKFNGLGFSSRAEDLVLFHFFDGWNSNQPDDVEYWTTPVYREQNLFQILYLGGTLAATRAIEMSRLPPPPKYNDCRFQDSLGLGVSVYGGPVEMYF